MDSMRGTRFHSGGFRLLCAMSNARLLAKRLVEKNAAGAEWQPMYDSLVAGLRRLEIGATAPRVGDLFPGFALPDARGRLHSLEHLLTNGPVVLSFNRGVWCPYCRGELETWRGALSRLDITHGQFVVVTPEVGGRAASLETILGSGAKVLCDVDHAVAMASGLAFFLGRPLIDRYRSVGLDLSALYGSDSGLVPVPATFVVDTDSTVAFAFTEVDFRLRADPDAVMAAVAALGR